MNRDEMLKRLQLTDQELYDLLEKFTAFHNSLNSNQAAAVKRSLPRLQEAQASFGTGATATSLQDLLGTPGNAVTTFYFLAASAD